MTPIEKQLAELISRATAALGDRLESILLYGSAARNEFDAGRSDLNILILTRQLDRHTLALAAPLFLWWLGLANPQPLLFTLEEFRRSTDAFPIEIKDIQVAHRLLYGANPLDGLIVNREHHRAQLEHELRAKLLRLRQKAIPILNDHIALLRLMEDSVTTFLLLMRHAMLLSDLNPPTSRRDLITAAHTAGLIQPDCFTQLIDLREGKLSPKSTESVQLFEDYLKQIQTLVASVDAL